MTYFDNFLHELLILVLDSRKLLLEVVRVGVQGNLDLPERVYKGRVRLRFLELVQDVLEDVVQLVPLRLSVTLLPLSTRITKTGLLGSLLLCYILPNLVHHLIEEFGVSNPFGLWGLGHQRRS